MNENMNRSDHLALILTERELAYLSRAIFRQRTDKPDDEPELASQLDPLISAARMNSKQQEELKDKNKK